MAPKDVQCPNPWNWEYATLWVERDFADVIKDFGMGRLSWVVCGGEGEVDDRITETLQLKRGGGRSIRKI